MKEKIFFLTKYSRNGASSRYRSLQYLPIIGNHGLEFEVSQLFSEEYLIKKYKNKRTPIFLSLCSLMRRFFSILRASNYSVVVIEYELIPFFPAIFEWLLRYRGCKLIVDYDDAIFHRYDEHKFSIVRILFKHKIQSVMRSANVVIVGNKYLANYAHSAGSKKVEFIPTVVDLSKYPVFKSNFQSNVFNIGWIGSPSTTKYLLSITPALVHMCKNDNVVVTLIGAESIELPGVSLRIIPWSHETEVKSLSRLDVGIMPLPDEPWARGKCGFKLIQYMASGLPVIASPVGVNGEIVDDGVNGFLSDSNEQWVIALEKLYFNKDLRAKMGAAGRKLIESKYCTNVTGVKITQLLTGLTKD
jgi:glycosyltransferase involved in cell wall biosynthesis